MKRERSLRIKALEALDSGANALMLSARPPTWVLGSHLNRGLLKEVVGIVF